MAQEYDSKAIMATISRISVVMLLMVMSLLTAYMLPPSFDSDEVKVERIKTDRLEMFMQKLNNMDDTTVRSVLENIENIEKALNVTITEKQ